MQVRRWATRLGVPAAGLGVALAAGCATPEPWRPTPIPAPPPLSALPRDPATIQPVSHETTEAQAPPAAAVPAVFGLDDLVRFAIDRNPRVARAAIAVDAAQGRYVQVGLYPNPELALAWDEIGDRTGPGGIVTAPRVTQPIVTGRKLTLAQAVAGREVDQAALDVLAERFAVIGSVRSEFYDAYALQQRREILAELVRLAEQGVEQGKALLAAERVARLDLVQLEVELERYRAEARAVERELPAAYQRLAAAAGDPRLPVGRLTGPFDAPPAYDLDAAREVLLAYHPQARSARVGVERAQAAIRAAEAQVIPNVALTGAYIRQYENKSHDGAVGLSAPIPVWNRNQGNVRAARAELGMAVQNVGRVENDLADRLAAAFRGYAAARARAENYRTRIVPRAEETYKLSMEAFRGGQFEYLRVIQAQRAVAEARLELNRSLGEAWRAAGEISGLLLEEAWPVPPTGPGAGPGSRPAPQPGPPE
ncbi:MAG: TolC family protein [Gemmataceae bacterium]